jgi:hypothetical protein
MVYAEPSFDDVEARFICDTDNGQLARVSGEDKANAQLIAAAPDLLAALRAIMVTVAGCERDPHWQAARAAIAAATNT